MGKERMIDMPGVGLRISSGTSREYLTLEGKLNSLSKKPGLLESYKDKHVVKKEVPKGSGKFILYDKNTKQPYVEKTARAQIFKRELGTSTPNKDLQYLKARDELKAFKSRTNQGKDAKGSWQYNVRRHFSDETDVEGVRESDVRVSNKAESLAANLYKLKIGTKYARDEKAAASEALLKDLPIENKVDIEQQTEIDKTKVKLDGNNKPNTNKPLTPQVQSGLSITDQANLKAQADKARSEGQLSDLRGGGGNTDGLKIRSDVHTIDPETNEAVGVLTRSQRKAFEARADVRKSLLEAQKNKKDLRIYKNRTAGG